MRNDTYLRNSRYSINIDTEKTALFISCTPFLFSKKNLLSLVNRKLGKCFNNIKKISNREYLILDAKQTIVCRIKLYTH